MLKLNKIYLVKILIGLFLFLPAKAEFDIKTDTAILQDYLSGKILFEKEPDKHIYPASMTKIMTTLLVFELIKNEGLSLGTSSGINIAGAIKLGKEIGPGKIIVTILCDRSDRYQSKLFNKELLNEKK